MRRTILLPLVLLAVLPSTASARSSSVEVTPRGLEIRSSWSPNGEPGSVVQVQAVAPAGVIVAFYSTTAPRG